MLWLKLEIALCEAVSEAGGGAADDVLDEAVDGAIDEVANITHFIFNETSIDKNELFFKKKNLPNRSLKSIKGLLKELGIKKYLRKIMHLINVTFCDQS